MDGAMAPERIETKRLVLRPYAATDWVAVHDYSSDHDVVRHVAWGPNEEADTRSFVSWAMTSYVADPLTDLQFAVTRRKNGRVIGGVGMHFANRRNVHSADVAGAFHREYWGRGYASEACSALVTHAFDGLGLHRVTSLVDPDNERSIALMERMGFRLEGRRRECRFGRGVWRDRLVYAVLAHEWSS